MQNIQEGNSNQNMGDMLSNYEAEHMIERLIQTDIEEYGSKEWFKQDEVVQKLNMQAHINAMMRADEFIMESMVTFDKVKLMIYHLLVAETWKQNILPIIKNDISKMSSLRSYITIYHEACLLNLLEVMLYHRTACEAADSNLIELLDYSYRKLTWLLGNSKKIKTVEKADVKKMISKTDEEQLNDQIFEIDVSISMMCLSILRFVTDHLKNLSVSIAHFYLVQQDVLCILVPLIEEKPWLRQNSKVNLTYIILFFRYYKLLNNGLRSTYFFEIIAHQILKGGREIFENNKWNLIDQSDYCKLPKMEAQVWIMIYNLFMDPDCRKKYELNDFRKSNLLKLRKYMNELLLDQLPLLTPMLRSLEELSVMNVMSNTLHNTFIIEQVPELKAKICQGKNWKELAEYQRKNYFGPQDQKQIEEDMKKLSELYGSNILESLTDGVFCAKCNKEASKRCSKCKSVWYCSRDCQVAHWKEHKSYCFTITNMKENNSNQKNEEPKKDKIIEEVKPAKNEISKQKTKQNNQDNELEQLD